MSGGVDSSVAAYLMKQRGFDCIGVTMKLFANEDIGVSREHSCCSLDDVEDARSVAYSLDMPYYVFNFSDRFETDVIDRFIHAYENGITPNPCIDCNRYLKFDKLYMRAKELDCDYVVTGHYARVEKGGNGRYLLKKALDDTKDQSYVLYRLTQEQLSHTIFPLGEMRKSQAREIAEAQGFINARKADSQDICFIPDGNYTSFIEARCGHVKESGNFLDMKGNVIGRHDGILNYTIGQRRGLKTGFGERLYVISKNSADNTVTLGHNSDLFGKRLSASSVNILVGNTLPESMRVCAKVRYSMKEQPATVFFEGNKRMTVEFDEPQRAFTSGQSVVLYDGDTVIGGGIIA